MNIRLMPALVAEFIGTFALIFVGAGAVSVGAGGILGAAFAHGMVVLGLAYAFGHVSGTHINPAVTLAMLVTRQITAARAGQYIIAQLLGGWAGALALRFFLQGTAWADGGLGVTRLAAGVSNTQGVLLEALLTFFLVTAVFNTAVGGHVGAHAGAAVGFTLVALILVGGPLTGAGLNPARSLGPALVTGDVRDLWLYLIGPIAGAIAAALLYQHVLWTKG